MRLSQCVTFCLRGNVFHVGRKHVAGILFRVFTLLWKENLVPLIIFRSNSIFGLLVKLLVKFPVQLAQRMGQINAVGLRMAILYPLSIFK